MGPNSRGRLIGRWRDRVKEYVCERGATRGGGLGGFSAVATPLGDVPGGSKASEL